MDWLIQVQTVLSDTASTTLHSAQLKILGEVALAMLLGGLIGVERELAHKPAGFRTHMLIAGAGEAGGADTRRIEAVSVRRLAIKG